jgi:hypothetical protein
MTGAHGDMTHLSNRQLPWSYKAAGMGKPTLGAGHVGPPRVTG